MAMAVSSPSRTGAQRPVTDTVSDLLGRDLQNTEHEDARAIREEFPSSPEDHRNLAMDVLEDYLGLEQETERLEQVLDVWSQEARDALRQGDVDQALRLVTAARRAGTRAIKRSGDLESLFKIYRRRVLDASMLRDLIKPGYDAAEVHSVLAPFGGEAVDALLDLLAEEEDRTRRAALISVLSRLARDHREKVIERLEDQRWYLVRNAVIILCRSGAGREIIPELEKVCRHEHPAVRREGIRGLVPLVGEGAMPHLRRMVKDSDESMRSVAIGFLGGLNSPAAVASLAEVARTTRDGDQRKQALEELGQHPCPAATPTLHQLASFGSHPRLPWRLRRHARALVRRRGSVK